VKYFGKLANTSVLKGETKVIVLPVSCVGGAAVKVQICNHYRRHGVYHSCFGHKELNRCLSVHYQLGYCSCTYYLLFQNKKGKWPIYFTLFLFTIYKISSKQISGL